MTVSLVPEPLPARPACAAEDDRRAHASRVAAQFPDHAVAIVGMAGRFPDAPDLGTFWRNIRDGVESLLSFSDEDMAAAGVPAAVRRNPRFVPKGTVLDGAADFDAEFFGITAAEARIMDPQHRLLLECGWSALEHAGYAPGRIGSTVGVYAGASMNSYFVDSILRNRPAAEAAGGYQLMLGNDKDFIATRLSYKLDLRGPSMTVQTACSTSLVAVELACRALARRECDMALAGGVSATFPERAGYLFEEGMIFSPDGHCRPFDAEARGTRGGAGVGLVVLKRLAEALNDGDTIHAVIRGIAVNNDGAAKAGYTAPSIEGQIEAIAMAQALGDVDPATIGYVEAHGTGTTLGDPIEIAALTRSFRAGTDAVGYCHLGALKANIGHLDAAAGVAGLIKTVLCLKHATIPPLVNFRTPNPRLDLETSPFSASAEAHDWPAGETPRRAAISSFGIGGTNAHAVLEEAPSLPLAAKRRAEQLIVVSARSAAALSAAARGIGASLSGPEAPALAEAAFTTQTGRCAFAQRRFVVASDPQEAASALDRTAPGTVHEGGARRVAMMFTGQGSQRPGMGQALYDSEPVYRGALDHCAEILAPTLGGDIRDIVFRSGSEELAATRIAQPALFATEYALARLWQSWGVTPAAMIGHSIGEYVAAHLAGVFTLEDALAIVAERGRLMQAMPPGAMVSVALPAAALRQRMGEDLEIAAENAAELSVASGPVEAVAALISALEAEGIACQRLKTSHAFHSRMMEGALDELEAVVAQVPREAPRLPYISNLTGDWITPELATAPSYYARHLRSPVRFEAGIRTLAADPALFLLEVGPGRALATLAQETAPTARDRIAPSLPRAGESGEVSSLLEASGRMWCAGVTLDWSGLHGAAQPRRVPLPGYPFERKRFWLDPAPEPRQAGSADQSQPLTVPGGMQVSLPTWSALPGRTGSTKLDGTWLVLTENKALSEAIAAGLQEAGATGVVTAAPATTLREVAPGIWDVRLSEPGDLQQVLETCEAAPRGIISAIGLGSGADAARAAYDALIGVARCAERLRLARPLRVLAVTEGATAFLGEASANPDANLVAGPVLALNGEDDRLRVRHVDLDAGDPSSWASAIVAEALCEDSELLVALRGGRRWARRYEATSLLPATTPNLRPGAVVLIVGGLGGVGLALARQLMQAAGARVVVTGRRPLPPRDGWEAAIAADHDRAEILHRLIALEAGPGEIAVAALDATDRDGLRALIARISERWGPLDGVIHAAGVAGAGVFAVMQSEGQAEQTFAPKIGGLRALVDVLGDTELGFFAAMSSINAILPVPGASDYAAANAVLDGWVESAEVPAAWKRVLCVNWEGWADLGMAARRADAPTRQLLAPERAAEVLIALLGESAPRAVVTPYDLPGAMLAVKRGLTSRDAAPDPAALAADTPPEATTETVAGAEPSAALFETEDQIEIARIWIELLGVEPQGPDESFFELGGHSLVATRLLSRIEARRGVKLTLRDVFDAPTIRGLAERVQGAGTSAPEQEEFLI